MDSITHLRLHQIEALTDDFSEDHKIGSGAYGDVYKAVLNGEEIAIKKLHPLQGLDDRGFDNQFRNLNKTHHKNIIGLIGYCYESQHRYIEHNGEILFAKILERLLLFEYMHNGSLDKYIEDEACGLDWPTCYQIIRGTCEGLNHLHNAQEKPIFHLNLNPTNILLDRSMTPKVAGFNLSSCGASLEWTFRTEIIQGRHGYMPPEYINNRFISKKFDVFSLGIIIIQMMAGNRGNFLASEMSSDDFIELVSENWKKRLQASSEYQSHETDMVRVRTCVEIALRCVNMDRKKRPCIEDIVLKLEKPEAVSNKVMSLAPNESKDLVLKMGSKQSHISLQHTETKPQNYTFQYLKDITNNFSDDRFLGSGGFAVVYKGVLENGEKVAVKKLRRVMPSSQEQFENEVNLLMKLKHPNIVRLVGYCYEMNHIHIPYNAKSVFAWSTECLFCLEYFPNGSLGNYISDASSGLDWHTRSKIIEGISYGLQYLHEQSNGPIIHLDLKPPNILLDENMVAKITDFDLSRLLDQTQTIQTTNTRGTYGYMSPELLRGTITPMSDIFSLGVIIMEIITGHRDYPGDIKKSSKAFIELELQKWRNRLQEEQGYTSLEENCQQIERFIQIGLICVNSERANRPTMRKIVDLLQGLESMNWYISNELSSHDIQVET